MAHRITRVTVTAHLAAGITLALLLQFVSLRDLRGEKLAADCGKNNYYECATEGKTTLGAFSEKVIHRWHRSR